MSGFDFGRQSVDFARYRPDLPESFYDRITLFIVLDGANIVNLGTGPGVISLALVRRGTRVIGVDIAENQIRTARQRRL